MDVMDQLGIPYFAYTLDEIVINRPMPQAQIDHLEFLKDPRVVLRDAIDPRTVVKLLMFINAADEETPRRLRQALQPETMGLQLIRTSGEIRLSNYLLWQLAYSEIYITDCLWPDFNRDELIKAIEQFNQRDRRFGGVKA